MYLEYINYQNVGVVRSLDISLSFNPNGSPKPIVFVGENGSGKSILLSNVVDAFYEIANKAYTNISVHDGLSTEYYKVISSNQISSNQKYMVAYLRFSDNEKPIEYIFKGGLKNWDLYNAEKFKGSPLNAAIKWPKENGNYKAVSFEKQHIDNNRQEAIERIFTNNVICHFPPNRYEKPNWLAASYHFSSENEHLRLGEQFSGKLYTPLTIINPANDNLKWLLDVIVDSRAELVQVNSADKAQINYAFAPRFNQGNLSPLLNARANVEQILSDILGKQVCFELSMRNVKTSGRFMIVERQTGNIVVPTFDSLSTGQMALFNLFVTIIRYADYNDLNKSIKLDDISGIVIIDEIELHLHSILQRDILPKLIRRFPKVQFIITSHSPLFILGMENLIGSNGYDLFQMPDGRKIGAEMFSEFQKAYEYLMTTQKYQSDISLKIATLKSKPLIVTEGKTDWIHLKAAYKHLKTIEAHNPIFNGMDIEFFEYTSDMGDSKLCSLCKSISKIKRDNAVIFIADADRPKATEDLAPLSSAKSSDEPPQHYKKHSLDICSRTYSFILPVPKHRKETPLICIEHYYSDEQIKCDVICDDDIARRLYMGNEFNSLGMGEGVYCGKRSSNKCGDGKIDIIDDDVHKAEKSSTTDIALPKKKFAENISNRTTPFENVDFESFLPIFEIIRDILIAEKIIPEYK